MDNSALSNLLRSNESQDSFVRRINQVDGCLFISFDTITELLGGEIEQSCKRFVRLGELYRRIGADRMKFPKGIAYALRKEIKRNGQPIDLPLVDNSARWAWLRSVLHDSSSRIIREYRAQNEIEKGIMQIREFSDILSETDKDFRKRFKSGGDVYPRKRLEELSRNLKFEDIEPFILSFRGLTHRMTRDIFYSTSDLYFYHRIYFILLFVRLQGNTMVNFDDGVYDFLSPINRGNWFDLGYIALAAKMDMLVTDDIGQRGITNLLNSKQIISARGISLKDF
jgi:hypothetical protein